ncbi:MAG: cysteine hydrolase family protein [Thermoleophilia bacterium]
MKLAEKVAPERTAIVVIDVQQEFFAAGGVIDQMGDDPAPLRAMVPHLAAFLDQARSLVRLVVFTRQTYAAELRSPIVEEHQMRSGMQRAPKPEAEEFYGLTPAPTDVVLPKNRYSAFVGTPFHTMLRANGITTLVLTGVATNVCVESTARQAYMLDYYVVVPRDLTGGVNEAAKEMSLLNTDRYFGEVVDSADVLRAWGIG